jgi:hypothetical protein
MEEFAQNLFKINELINDNDETMSIIKVKMLSKQYLAYYIYRIITKYIKHIENGASYSDIVEFMTYLRIPVEHNNKLSYPLVGKMTNDNELLDLIILRGIDMLTKTNKYLNSLSNTKSSQDMIDFFKEKDLTTMLQDLIDLQKLIPGLSVSAIRPSYLNNAKV